MAVFPSRKIEVKYPPPKVGTTWIYTEDGTFVVPIDGKYQIEMHGGGGGGCYYLAGFIKAASGGGSGEIHIKTLTKGDQIPTIIGKGGKGYGGENLEGSGYSGGSTVFGDLSVAGGEGGSTTSTGAGTKGGAASGSIATSGIAKSAHDVPGNSVEVDGGLGNKNNTSILYGTGGSAYAVAAYGDNSQHGASYRGKNGAVIITLLEVY